MNIIYNKLWQNIHTKNSSESGLCVCCGWDTNQFCRNLELFSPHCIFYFIQNMQRYLLANKEEEGRQTDLWVWPSCWLLCGTSHGDRPLSCWLLTIGQSLRCAVEWDHREIPTIQILRSHQTLYWSLQCPLP